MASKASISASPPIDRIAVAWALRAREHYRGGRVDEACAAARLAVAAWRRFGPKMASGKAKGRKPEAGDESVHMPREVANCISLLKKYGEETQ